MKTFIVVIAIILFSALMFGQGQSARLAGMGNLSIALPDAESEALVNPAKATRLKGLVIRGNPFLSNYSSKLEGTSTSSSGSSSSSTSEVDNGVRLLPVDVLLSLGPLVLGGSAALSSNSSKNNSRYNQSSSSYTETSQSDETNGSGKTFTARGAFDLGIIAVGGTASLITDVRESKSTSSYSYTGETSGSSLSEYKYEQSGRNFQAGALIGNPEQFEISVVAFLLNMDSEGKPTKFVQNGTPQPLDKPYVSFDKNSFSGLTADVRHQLTENVLIGGRFSLGASTSEMSAKSQWYDDGSSQPIYENRKTGTSETSSYQLAAALTWQVTGVAMLGLEFSLAPTTTTLKDFFTTSGTGNNNIPYSRGTVRNESTHKGTISSLRLGGEIAVSESFTLRSGGEVIWISAESSSKDHYYSWSSELKGQAASTFYVSGGFSYNFGFVRIDYALGVIPILTYAGYYGPWPYSSFYQDVMFQNQLTLTLQL